MGRKIHAKGKEKQIKEKRRLEAPKFFRICPKCGSAKVAVSKAKQQEGLPFQYKCRKCSYTSYFFPETTKEQLKKHSKKRYKVARVAGRNIKKKTKG